MEKCESREITLGSSTMSASCLAATAATIAVITHLGINLTYLTLEVFYYFKLFWNRYKLKNN